ncbi:hypothetical protein ACFE04_015155 [Oxalis oulophora]
MASNNPNDAPTDDFLEQILGLPNFSDDGTGATPMMLQLNSGDGSGTNLGAFHGHHHNNNMFPLGLSLEQGMKHEDASLASGKRFLDDVVYNTNTNSSSSSSRGGGGPPIKNVFHGQPMHTSIAAAPHPPIMRPRVRARRGQATDPHSIAERLRRERIAERIRALQDLVPSVNKTDRAAMLDDVVDYVKFLRLQVKVLSMSRLGAAGAVAPLVTDIPLSSVEDESGDGRNQPAWEKFSNDGTERQVAKLMEENVGAAMQFLQSKALCIMPISLAAAIYHSQPPDSSSFVKPESNNPP